MTHPGRPLVLLLLVLACAAQAAAQTAPAERQAGGSNDGGPGRLRDTVERWRRLDLQARGAARRFERFAGNERTEAWSRDVRFPERGTLDIRHVSGSVVITGSGGDTVRIEAVKRVRPRDAAQAEALLRAMTVSVTERPDGVEIRSDTPRPRAWPGVVDLTVAVPAGASVWVRNGAGRIQVSGIRGTLRLESVSADIAVSEAGDLARLRSVSGHIDVRDAEGTDITGGTVSGTVVLNGVEARGLDWQSVSGPLQLRDVTLDHASLRTVSGDIDYSGPLARNGRYEMRTHGGRIRVVPRGRAAFDLEAATLGGNIRSDVDLRGTALDGGGRGIPGRPAARRLTGRAGDGGARLDLQSFSGAIVVARP